MIEETIPIQGDLAHPLVVITRLATGAWRSYLAKEMNTVLYLRVRRPVRRWVPEMPVMIDHLHQDRRGAILKQHLHRQDRLGRTRS